MRISGSALLNNPSLPVVGGISHSSVATPSARSARRVRKLPGRPVQNPKRYCLRLTASGFKPFADFHNFPVNRSENTAVQEADELKYWLLVYRQPKTRGVRAWFIESVFLVERRKLMGLGNSFKNVASVRSRRSPMAVALQGLHM